MVQVITFKYTDEHHDEYGTGVNLSVTTTHEHLDGVVNVFKTFLIHVGHHPANVERVVLQGPEEREGLPMQMELPL
jgi:hypothetical protein